MTSDPEFIDVLITITKRDEVKFQALFANGESWWLSRHDVAKAEQDYVDAVEDGETISLLIRADKLRELGVLRS